MRKQKVKLKMNSHHSTKKKIHLKNQKNREKKMRKRMIQEKIKKIGRKDMKICCKNIMKLKKS